MKEKLEPVFIQKYYEGCPVDHLFGTKEIPVYQIGWSKGFDDRGGYTAWYPDWISKSRPRCITPSYFKFSKINIQLGKDVRIGIEMPIDINAGEDEDGWTWIRVGFPEKTD